MNLKGQNVLITGAGGFIGSHLTESLVKAGAKVGVFVKYNSRSEYGMIEQLSNLIKSKINVIKGDLKDFESVNRAVEKTDVIFHLGAIISIPYSYENPSDVINTNVQGTLNVLNAARKNGGIKKIIHTSTSEVYGSANYVPIDEKHPLCAQSPYSASKIAADKISESYYRSFGLPIATIRPFNTYGPRQSARAVIPAIISQALVNKKIILGSLKPTRDFTYVKDTIKGFIKVAESENAIGEVVNIGSNFEISIGDLVSKISSILGIKINVIQDKGRVRPKNSEVNRLLCDNTKAKNILGWKPKVTLDEGLGLTIDWVKNNLDSFKKDIYNF